MYSLSYKYELITDYIEIKAFDIYGAPITFSIDVLATPINLSILEAVILNMFCAYAVTVVVTDTFLYGISLDICPFFVTNVLDWIVPLRANILCICPFFVISGIM
jgi:hypothetical protein